MIIPTKGRDAVLQELHDGHTGMSRMKSRARMFVWWLGIDADIEKSVFFMCSVSRQHPHHHQLH